ncbi:zinc finger protein [Trichonephila clavipes]|nr:zinc finger protein [Trichonephila clavipes]
MELTQQDSLQAEIEVPVVPKKPRIPPFFISPKGDWRQLVALAKLKAPSFQSQMSGRFLRVTVSDEVEYRDLSRWLESTGVEFKSFMLKQDRPVKVVVRGLPSNTELSKPSAGRLKTPFLSLSALRSASADVDKTYVIFEAYCRLRSLQA